MNFPKELENIVDNMKPHFLIATRYLIDVLEGFDYHDIPEDIGGGTKGGISQNWVRLAKPIELEVNEVKDLSYKQIIYLYHKYFFVPYTKSRCGIEMKEGFDVFHFFNLVVSGPKRAAICLQRAIKKFNVNIVDDGIVGKNTILTLNERHEKDFDLILLYTTIEYSKFYGSIVSRDNTQVRFLNGWMNRIERSCDFVNKHRISCNKNRVIDYFNLKAGDKFEDRY